MSKINVLGDNLTGVVAYCRRKSERMALKSREIVFKAVSDYSKCHSSVSTAPFTDDLEGGRPELLMVGMSSQVYRIRDFVIKVLRFEDDEIYTNQNRKAVRNEASIYIALGRHPRIAEYLHVGLLKDYTILKYYQNGTIKKYMASGLSMCESKITQWVHQIIESIQYIHSVGVFHADLRLDQWLLDDQLNVRLSDFDGAGYRPISALGLEGSSAMNLEKSSHFLPRDPLTEDSAITDLFAMGSTIYELVVGKTPYEHVEDSQIEDLYSQKHFPDVEGVLFGEVMKGCWHTTFQSATDALPCAMQHSNLNKEIQRSRT